MTLKRTCWQNCDCLDCRVDRAVKSCVAEAVEVLTQRAREVLLSSPAKEPME